MSAGHTATPWRLHEEHGADIYSDARGGWFVGTTSANGHPGGPGDDFFGQDRIDAAHIVRCVNAHDDLVAALRVLLRHYDEDEQIGVYEKLEYDAFEAARALLAKVAA